MARRTTFDSVDFSSCSVERQLRMEQKRQGILLFHRLWIRTDKRILFRPGSHDMGKRARDVIVWYTSKKCYVSICPTSKILVRCKAFM